MTFKELFAPLGQRLRDICDGKYRKVYNADGKTFRLIHENDLPVEASLSCSSTTVNDVAKELNHMANSIEANYGIQLAHNLRRMRSMSKRSKKASERSRMLKLVMPELSRDQGDELARAVATKDRDRVKEILSTIGENIARKL